MAVSAESVTPSLIDVLKGAIKERGPLPVHDFHQLCLNHPRYGYYRVGRVLGREGDFLTAPELSSLFGEMVGVWLVDAWQKQGSPPVVQLLEMGPGRGLLMQDVIRAAKIRPAFLGGAHIRLVEVHKGLQRVQEKTLAPVRSEVKDISWHAALSDIVWPAQPLFCLANEFFDVLPAHQYVRQESCWRERCVAIKGDHDFCFVTQEQDLSLSHIKDHDRYQRGMIVEISPQSQSLLAAVATHIKRYGGAMFVCDYGYETPDTSQPGFSGDSWQALYQGNISDPLQHPGLADLSFHVHFGVLEAQARAAGLSTSFMTQRDFLHRMGLSERVAMLGKKASQDLKGRLAAQATRLAHPLQMGSLFKVLLASAPLDPQGAAL
ncbi:class I SAM-dependent methyltransferase [Candidatus Hepatobacter penaei]|uniref:class I SAM-dependent methyltransferase n=1 Tax=Candidatus Hepatobacter penaei TaxID=1274402 RepID=UPI000696D3B9|nr:SAM-dependent methyltransferase [Candidatus Hepatobacter penaei]